MSPEVKKFIEKNIKHIEREEFKLLYISLNALWNSFGATENTKRFIGEFTEVMLGAGINPLSYLENIPKCYLYRSDTYVKNLNISKKLVDINAFAFCGNTTLESVNVNTEYVESGAFSQCVNLQRVELKSTVELGSDSFAACSSLTEVKLPKTLQYIKYSAFYGCDNLREIKFEGTVTDWLNVKINPGWMRRSEGLGVATIEIKCANGILNEVIP